MIVDAFVSLINEVDVVAVAVAAGGDAAAVAAIAVDGTLLTEAASAEVVAGDILFVFDVVADIVELER